jgi:hypothetical protein
VPCFEASKVGKGWLLLGLLIIADAIKFNSLNLYGFSVKRQQIAPRKMCCIDTGLSNAVGFSFSPNTNRIVRLSRHNGA